MRAVKPTALEVHEWVDMTEKFNEQVLLDENFDWGFNRENCEDTYFAFIRDQICFWLEHDGKRVGCIACVESRHLYNYAFRFCLEVMFYVEHQYRSGARVLIKAVEEECKQRGINRIVMAHMTHNKENIGSFYKALGYRECEWQYQKDLHYGD